MISYLYRSNTMDKRQKGYEAFIAQLRKHWEETEEFQGSVQPDDRQGAGLYGSGGDLTRDELALIAEYEAGSRQPRRGKARGARIRLYAGPKDTAWSWLADVTDRAQVEWQELADELEHKGIYRAGDWVGLGVLVCDHCEVAPYGAAS